MSLRRSILSIPGHKVKMHQKAISLDCDIIMFDLEDSVPYDKKEEARQLIIESILQNKYEKKISIRINSIEDKFGYRDLLELAENAGDLIDTFVIPKVNYSGQIHFAHILLDGIEKNKCIKNRIGLEASIETAKGMESIKKIARSSSRLKSLIFGIADYSISVNARLVSLSGHGEQEDSIYPGHRWHFALSRIIMSAKANGLYAIDAPYGNFKDSEGLKKSAQMSCSLGCDGKWAIHPDQISIINKIFYPSIEDINRAKQIVNAFQDGENNKGAIAIDGRMIDQATYRLAQQVLMR